MFARIALMFRNIHFGGAFSGIRSIIFSKSKPPQRRTPRGGEQRNAEDGGADQQTASSHTSLDRLSLDTNV